MNNFTFDSERIIELANRLYENKYGVKPDLEKIGKCVIEGYNAEKDAQISEYEKQFRIAQILAKQARAEDNEELARKWIERMHELQDKAKEVYKEKRDQKDIIEYVIRYGIRQAMR